MRKRLRLMLVSFVTGALCALAVVGALTVPDAVSGLVPDRLKTSAAMPQSRMPSSGLLEEAFRFLEEHAATSTSESWVGC